MHVGKSCRLTEFLRWTRRRIYVRLLVAAVPVVLYQSFGLKWIALPWGWRRSSLHLHPASPYK
jgi:putative membrane protein